MFEGFDADGHAADPEDARAAHALAGTLLARMPSDPPPAGRETAALYRIGRGRMAGT